MRRIAVTTAIVIFMLSACAEERPPEAAPGTEEAAATLWTQEKIEEWDSNLAATTRPRDASNLALTAPDEERKQRALNRARELNNGE